LLIKYNNTIKPYNNPYKNKRRKEQKRTEKKKRKEKKRKEKKRKECAIIKKIKLKFNCSKLKQSSSLQFGLQVTIKGKF
jgi:hypothetical protein